MMTLSPLEVEASPAVHDVGGKRQVSMLAKQVLAGVGVLLLGFFAGAGFQMERDSAECDSLIAAPLRHGSVSYEFHSSEPQARFELFANANDDDVANNMGWHGLGSGLAKHLPAKLAEAGLSLTVSAKTKLAGASEDNSTAELVFDLDKKERDALEKSMSPAFNQASAKLNEQLINMGLLGVAMRFNADIEAKMQERYVIGLANEKLAEDGIEVSVHSPRKASQDTSVRDEPLDAGRVLLAVTSTLAGAHNQVWSTMPKLVEELLGVPASMTLEDVPKTIGDDENTFRVAVTPKDFSYNKMLGHRKNSTFAGHFSSALNTMGRLERLGMGPMGAYANKLSRAVNDKVLEHFPEEVAQHLQQFLPGSTVRAIGTGAMVTTAM